MKSMNVDVAIIGGGPAGATVGSLLKKYDPSLRVAIFEREKFPRDHVGESHLPPASEILYEMGAWEKIEAANFPIKIGGTYRWGQSDDLWDFEFLPIAEVEDEPRPAQFRGWRTRVAFQVDRMIYDKILLDHASEMGCQVFEETGVRDVNHENDTISGLILDDGTTVTARYYVDGSGGVGFLRRALGIPTDVVNDLKNIAIWDYWENADWAIQIGVGGTRIQVMSLGYGWIWFIPIGPTRTSVGLVIPAQTYKDKGLSADETYMRAIKEDPRISALLKNATREEKVRTTKDWSFVAGRTVGRNWFLCGESAGFADPILSAGVTLTHLGGRDCAYTILELDKKDLDADWLRKIYDEAQRLRIWQHIRFAQFWYTGNGRFKDLKNVTAQIAKDAGYEFDPNAAFKWFASGTFTNDSPTATLAHHSVATAKYIAQHITQQEVTWEVAKVNRLKVDFHGASRENAAEFYGGRIHVIECYRRNGKILRLSNLNDILVKAITSEPDAINVFGLLQAHFQRYARHPAEVQERMIRSVEALEALLLEGWVTGEINLARPMVNMKTPWEPGPYIHPNLDKRPEELSVEAVV
jgi:flavin-dependent dehydrogenase